MSERRYDRRTLLKAGAAAFLTGGTILRGRGGVRGNSVAGSGLGAELVQAGPAENSSKRTLAMISFDGSGDQLPPPVYKKPHVTIAEENAKEGHSGWKLTRPDPSVAAFTVPSSVEAGENLNFHVATSGSQYKLSLFRLGWYGGKGGRLVYEQDSITAPRIGTRTDQKTHTVTADWSSSHSLAVPDDWRSGMYVAVATNANGGQCLTPFWVRSRENVSPVVASSGLLTSTAYNNWNSLSLYGGVTGVSLDRAMTNRENWGDVLPWDLATLRFMEKSGIDVDYVTDLDSHEKEDIFDGRRVILLMGHHEYYTEAMRRRVEKAAEDGVNIALFGCNALYWRITLEDTQYGKNRIVVCHKERKTGSGRDTHYLEQYRELGYPEARLFGVAYETTANGDDWVVADPSHWVFEGAGVERGTKFKGLIGPECDIIFPEIPTGKREILAESLVNAGPGQGHSYSCLVTHDSGAKVFTTGSPDWSLGLDSLRIGGWKLKYPVPAPDPRTEVIARNVLSGLSK